MWKLRPTVFEAQPNFTLSGISNSNENHPVFRWRHNPDRTGASRARVLQAKSAPVHVSVGVGDKSFLFWPSFRPFPLARWTLLFQLWCMCSKGLSCSQSSHALIWTPRKGLPTDSIVSSKLGFEAFSLYLLTNRTVRSGEWIDENANRKECYNS